MAQGIVRFREFLELFQSPFQVGTGRQGATQELHGAAEVEVEVRIFSLLLPGVNETFFRFQQALTVRPLGFPGNSRIEQGFSKVVVTPELKRFQLHGQALGGQISFQVFEAFLGVVGGQPLLPVAQTLALLKVAFDRVDEGFQAQFLRGKLHSGRIVQRLTWLEFGKLQREQVRFHLKEQAAEQGRKPRQFRPKPADEADRFVHFQGLEGLFYLAGSQQHVTHQAGQKLMILADLFELVGFVQSFLPALQLAESQ